MTDHAEALTLDGGPVASGGFDPNGLKAPEVELTILMPCLDEAATVAKCVTKALGFLKRTGIVGEVLVADNGSRDDSRRLAQTAGARVVPVAERGYGAALKAGIEAAHGRFVIMGDADDSYDFETLDRMVAALRGGRDLVMGNRFRGGIAPGAMPPLHRYLGNPVLSFVGRLFFGVPIGDFHCGLRGFSRRAVLDLRLKCSGMEFASEMVVKAALNKLSIGEVPTTLKPDGRGRAPHLRTWRDGWRHLVFLLTHCPRWLFLYPGAIMLVAGLLGMASLAAGPARISPMLALGVHTLVASSMAVLVGVQFLLMAALARRWGITEGFLPGADSLRRFLFGLTLETVLLGALAIGVAGIGGLVWATLDWASSNFGDITDPTVLRVVIISCTAVSIAVQTAASGFFASILAIRK